MTPSRDAAHFLPMVTCPGAPFNTAARVREASGWQLATRRDAQCSYERGAFLTLSEALCMLGRWRLTGFVCAPARQGALRRTAIYERCESWNATSVARRAPAQGHVLSVALLRPGSRRGVVSADRERADDHNREAVPVALSERLARIGAAGCLAEAQGRADRGGAAAIAGTMRTTASQAQVVPVSAPTRAFARIRGSMAAWTHRGRSCRNTTRSCHQRLRVA